MKMVSLFNGISIFLGYLMPNQTIKEEQQWYYLTNILEDKVIYKALCFDVAQSRMNVGLLV